MAASTVFASFAMSLDGYIASETRDMGWLNDLMAADEDYGFAETMGRTGAYVLGANTYRETMAGAGGGSGDKTPTYVVTHQRDWPKAGKHVRFVGGDLREVMDAIRAESTKDVWVFGGGALVGQCLELDLLDELSLAVLPVVLGGGVPLARGLTAPKRLRLAEFRPFPSGIVMVRYERGLKRGRIRTETPRREHDVPADLS